MNPETIIEKVREMYTRCRTYSDSGRILPGKRPDIELLESSFRTSFMRLGNFVFEWSDGISRELIWTQENNAFTMSEDRNRKAVDNARIAIASAVGISMGSVDNILPLLLDVRSNSILDLHDLTVDGASSSNYIILGRTEKSENISLSIQRDLFFIRRISREIILTPDTQASLSVEAEDRLYRLREEGKLSEGRFQEFMRFNAFQPTDEVITRRTEFVFDQVSMDSGEDAAAATTEPDFELYL